MDLDPYLTTNVLKIFPETLSIRYYHVDATVVVLVVGVGVIVPGTGVGLCVTALMVVLGFKSV